MFNEKITKPAELKTEYKSDYSNRILKLFDKADKRYIIDKIRRKKIFDEKYYSFIAGSISELVSDIEINLLSKLFHDENGIKENVFITDIGLIFNVGTVKVLRLNKFLRDIDKLKRIDECAMNF